MQKKLILLELQFALLNILFFKPDLPEEFSLASEKIEFLKIVKNKIKSANASLIIFL